MGAHPVQPYPPRKMAPARLHPGTTSGQGEASFCVLMSEPRGGQTNRKRPQLVGGGGLDPSPAWDPGTAPVLLGTRGWTSPAQPGGVSPATPGEERALPQPRLLTSCSRSPAGPHGAPASARGFTALIYWGDGSLSHLLPLWAEGLRAKQDPGVRAPSCSRVGEVGGPRSPWCCPSGGTQAFSAIPSTNGICVFDIVSVIIFVIQNRKNQNHQDFVE